MMFDTFDRTGQADFPFSRATVFRAVKEAIRQIRGMKIENSNELACRLDLKTGISIFSWGERISVSVAATRDRTSAVSISSGAKTIFGSAITHGKNKQNVRDILTAISDILQRQGATWEDEIAPQTKASVSSSQNSIADELIKLAALRDQGILTSQEFDAQKRRLLAQ